jgi:cation:H+ antiporter
MLVYILFIFGFVLLIKGADYLIKGASVLSKKYNVSEITIGLTVVALGTSLPEIFVNIFASLKSEHDLIIGNIAGSNMANLFLVLGVAALITPLLFSKTSVRIDIPFALSSVYLLLLLVFSYFFIFGSFVLTRFHGFLFLVAFVVYVFFIFKRKSNLKEKVEAMPLSHALTYIVLGSLSLFLGGEFVVSGAVRLAGILGFSTLFVGASIIALGTSLPELVTIIISLSKKKHDFAIGNIIGSNIFNVLLVLGISALITPIHFSKVGVFNFLLVAFSMILLMFFLIKPKLVGGKYVLKSWHGYVFLVLYVSYLFFVFFN